MHGLCTICKDVFGARCNAKSLSIVLIYWTLMSLSLVGCFGFICVYSSYLFQYTRKRKPRVFISIFPVNLINSMLLI